MSLHDCAFCSCDEAVLPEFEADPSLKHPQRRSIERQVSPGFSEATRIEQIRLPSRLR
jgi:hypothetical protein